MISSLKIHTETDIQDKVKSDHSIIEITMTLGYETLYTPKKSTN
jgi:hypothetical protein